MSIGDISDKVDRFDRAARAERLHSPQIIQSTKAVRFPTAIVSDLYIFEVQSAAAADGIYVCYKQATFGSFGPPNIEVLNLLENDTLEDYIPALAKGDRIAAWQMPDEEGTMRWVGIPNTPSVRMARTKEAAGSNTYINCNLMANDGETEITSGLGADIDVYCKITRDIDHDEYDLSSASPRLAAGDYIFIQNISGKWWCTTVFQVSENCLCE